ncbi:hypothetical protein BYZ73_01285 [Rhodovulum viride]|uniref:Uncharacterized protein n=1 Tax=Rhodovulum viride TaxID=1231134 RepID=A0ABX9DPA9_9RHOB|nr:hypothetical protein BYZ73_01285 [Rhodovulum viride]
MISARPVATREAAPASWGAQDAARGGCPAGIEPLDRFPSGDIGEKSLAAGLRRDRICPNHAPDAAETGDRALRKPQAGSGTR